MNNGKVSVVVPWAGASEQHLFLQLHALSNQSYTAKFEIILSCNTLVALSKAESIRQIYTDVVVVDSTQVVGVSFARNNGAHFATGDKLLFCDADDLVSSNWVKELADGLESYDFVASALDYSRLNGKRFKSSDSKGKIGLNRPLNFLPMAPGGASAFTREAFQAVGGFNLESTYTEDVDISWRLQIEGRSLGFMPKAVLCYRLENNFMVAFRKHVKYGISVAKLAKEFESFGARVKWMDTARDVSKFFLALVLFPVPYLRVKCGYIWGFFLGRLWGSVKYRIKAI